MNKMDRPSRDPLELLDELESVLADRRLSDELAARQRRRVPRRLRSPKPNGAPLRTHRARRDASDRFGFGSVRPAAARSGQRGVYEQFREGIELLDGAGERFDRTAMLQGKVSPVFFGSAVTNFGVQLFLDEFIEMAPAPSRRAGVEPTDESFSGFVFKIQANMDPRHRDRIAFVRVCSGEFARDMTVRNSRAPAPTCGSRGPCASSPTIANRSTSRMPATSSGWPTPGPSPSATRSTKDGPSASLRFPPLPRNISHRCGVSTFRVTSRLVRESRNCAKREPCKSSIRGARREPNRSLGAVGELQFEVAKYRLESEYNVKTILHTLPYALARHVEGDRDAIARAQLPSNAKLVEDWSGRPTALFESEWSVRLAEEWNPQLRFVPFTAREDDEALAS